MTEMMSLMGVGKSYGALRVLEGVSFVVRSGARHAIIGPNGAGKSTLFAIMSGRLRLSDGSIRYGGNDITTVNEVGRADLGIQQTFQHSSLFLSMSALENVAIAVQQTQNVSARWWRPAHRYSAVIDSAVECLTRLGLRDKAGMPVGELSHGERRQLEVAISLARDPAVLMLDEPTAGMSAAETARFVDLVQALPSSMTVLFVEHDIDVVMSLATQITVLNLGQVVATGSPTDIAQNDAVQAAYLSGSAREDLFADDAEELT